VTQPLLELRNLSTEFPTRRGTVRAVEDVSLRLEPGEILGIVGESGCGKSTVLLSVLRLIARPGRIVGGEILFRGQNLLNLPSASMRDIRGKEISMIFQDPLSTLNPVFPVGEQIREAMRLHGIIRKERWSVPRLGERVRRAKERARVLDVMQEVGISAVETRYGSFPHQFSGGMQQRALIAIGLVCQPALILADEPTTALDVTIQAQIMTLMRQINREHGTSIILVTHNLGLAAEFCHSLAVMYAGRVVERGSVDEVIENPKHPYTQGLLNCLPRITTRQQKLEPISGNVPDLADLPPGCAFAPRCSFVQDGCWDADVTLRQVGADHYARCILYDNQPVMTQNESEEG
jgi:oligopeptide/dipeptide ABC transporter ATP-binding protein